MKRIPLSWRSVVLSCVLLALGSQVEGANSLTAHPKLGKELTPIAEAAARHAEIPLMSEALVRQALHGYSPLEPHWNSLDQVQVYLHYDPQGVTPDTAALKGLGAADIKVSPRLKVIQAWVPATALDTVAQLDGVLRVSLPRYAVRRADPPFGPRAQTGSVTTQGDKILGSASFRSATGIDGQGISVGVISDGADHISDSQKTGDLPANVWKDPSLGGKGDEGTAMMEIVYDLAPGLKRLGFCGPNTTADFLTCLDDFNTNIGANVIVDDLAFPGGAMFSDDDFNTGIRDFVSAHPNTHLVTATGNDATGYWQGTWNPIPLSPPGTTVNGVTYTQAEDFGGGTPYLQISVPSGDKIAYLVEWNDPWDDKATTNDLNDYDVVVFDNPTASSGGSTGHEAVACNQGTNIGPDPNNSNSTLCKQSNTQSTVSPGPRPVQGSEWTAAASTYYLEVFLHAASPGPNLKILVFDMSKAVPVQVTPSTPGSVYGHAALPSPNEISVGAVDAPDALFGNYNIESYSSLGPVEYGVTPNATVSIQKPDFVAPDCVSVTGAGSFENPFCGTSAAAPHIAGLLALLMQGYPGQSPYTLLQQAATPIGTASPNGTYGFGIPIVTSLLSAGDYPVPAAKITAPTDGATLTAGQAEAFSGTCTADKAVGNLKFDWNFGTGSGIADSSTSAPNVTFASAGTYTVSLKCTGSSGSGSTSISVTVNAPAKSGGGSLDLLGLTALLLSAAARRRRSRA